MELSCAVTAASRTISSPFLLHRPSRTTLRSSRRFSSFVLSRNPMFNINFSSRSIRGIRVPRSMTPEEDSTYASVVKEEDAEREMNDEEEVVEEKREGSSVIEYSENSVASELSEAMDILNKLDLKDTLSATVGEEIQTLSKKESRAPLVTQEAVIEGDTSSVLAEKQMTVEGEHYKPSANIVEKDDTSSLILADKLKEESETLLWIAGESQTSPINERQTPLNTHELVTEVETSSIIAEQMTVESEVHNSSGSMVQKGHTSSVILADKLEEKSDTSSWIMEEQNDMSKVVMQEDRLPIVETSNSSMVDKEKINSPLAVMGIERIIGERPNSSVTTEEKICTLSCTMEVERITITQDGLNVWDENDKGSPVVEHELLLASEYNDEMNFLSKPTAKLEAGDTYTILAYGIGTFLTLWLSSAVVGALDSVPVLPKFMEITGFGFTVWFTYRYLIFKRNRDELFAKIDDLKEQILGPPLE